MTNEDVGASLVLDKSVPELSTVVATRYSALRSPEVNETTGGLQEAMAASLEQARTEPLVPEWLEVQAVLEVAINEIANGADVKESLDTAAADVEEIMSRAGYY